MTDAPTDLLRVSDAERQFVVDRLRDEAAAGRLMLDVFDERAGAAYTARTRADLLHLLRDLPGGDLAGAAAAGEPEPSVDPLAGPPDLDHRARCRFLSRMRSELTVLAGLNGAAIAIDLFVPGTWWVWVLFGSGVSALLKAAKGLDGDRRAVLRDWHRQRAEQPAVELG